MDNYQFFQELRGRDVKPVPNSTSVFDRIKKPVLSAVDKFTKLKNPIMSAADTVKTIGKYPILYDAGAAPIAGAVGTGLAIGKGIETFFGGANDYTNANNKKYKHTPGGAPIGRGNPIRIDGSAKSENNVLLQGTPQQDTPQQDNPTPPKPPKGKSLSLQNYNLEDPNDVKKLQKKLGFTGNNVDGKIGPITMGALESKNLIPKGTTANYIAGKKTVSNNVGNGSTATNTNNYETPEDKYVYGSDGKVTDAYFNGAEKQFYNLHNQDTVKNTEVANPGSNAKLDALGKLYDDKKITREAYNHAANAILNPNQNSTPAQTAPQGWFDKVADWATRERTPEEKAAMRQQVYNATGIDTGSGPGLAERSAYNY